VPPEGTVTECEDFDAIEKSDMVDTLTELLSWADATVMERDEPEDALQDDIVIIDILALGGECIFIFDN
jgi:hypothetical protein